MTYSEALKHPKWQEKRLRVLEAAGFECGKCGTKDKTLHVHHGYYERGLSPWEYDDGTLHVLCEDCHAKTTEITAKVQRLLGYLDQDGLRTLHGLLLGWLLQEHPDNSGVIEYGLADLDGLMLAWGLTAGDESRVLDAFCPGSNRITGKAMHLLVCKRPECVLCAEWRGADDPTIRSASS